MQKIEKYRDVKFLVGDQSDVPTLQRWLADSKGGFNVIVDDGGHGNIMMLNSFQYLFPSMAPGGLYFIEDLCFSRYPERLWIKRSEPIMVDVIKDWIEQLLTPSPNPVTNKIPAGIKSIMCQYDACVIAKCDSENDGDAARCSE